jgi:CO/xanthine dehydrogenase FAD-binding subunit
MSPFEVYRPQTIDDAIELLAKGVPLSGGTVVTAKRYEFPGVIDLQDLELDWMEVGDRTIRLGASYTLQAIVEAESSLPQALRHAARQEAGWNIRNRATLGGSIITGDGRSPLLTILLTLGAEVNLEPGKEIVPLDDLLDKRGDPSFCSLITSVDIIKPSFLTYDQVSRSPADWPIVCAAVGRLPGEDRGEIYRVVLGGFGSRPICIPEAETHLTAKSDSTDIAQVASQAYAIAGDDWATAEYRSHVAGVLVRRLTREMID